MAGLLIAATVLDYHAYHSWNVMFYIHAGADEGFVHQLSSHLTFMWRIGNFGAFSGIWLGCPAKVPCALPERG